MPSSSPKLTFLDRVVSYVSPEAGFRRSAARDALHQFGYDGVARDGKRGTGGGSMFRNGSPESPKIGMDAVKLMWESRDMERNFCIWDGILTRIVLYAVGTIRWQSKTGDSKIDAAREKYWEEWCKTADVTKRHHFYTLVRLVMRSMLRDRDAGLLTSEDDGQLRVQGIEADRIGNPQMAGGTSDESEIQGFHLGDEGQIETVDIYKRSRTNMYTLDKNVPIERFLHVFDPKRLDQYRGVCWGAAAMPHMRDLYEALGNEMTAIKFAGSFAGFTRTQAPFAQNGVDAFGGTPLADGTPTLKVLPGMIQRLQQGEEMIFAPGTTRPSGAFIAFFETKVREIAVGLNLPFGFVWNLALLGGVTARIELGQMKRSLSWLRGIAVESVLDKVLLKVMRRGVAHREIPGHKLGYPGSWSFGADITGDAGNDVSSDISKLEAGLVTEVELIETKYGGDFEETVRAQARSVQVRHEIAMETGVPIELQTGSNRLAQATTLLASMNSRGDEEAEGAVLAAAGMEAPVEGEEAPPAASGLMVTHGKDAVKSLTDILKKVNTQEITREQAVNILVTSFDMELDEAEAIVPPVPVYPGM